MAFVQSPATYYYIDAEGIHSLYAQSVGHPEVEKSTTIEKTVKGKAGVNAKLKHLLLKLIAGTDFEITGEVSGSRKRIEESKKIVRIENELQELLKTLEKAGLPFFFTTLAAAARHAEESESKVFMSVHERFNAPQFRVTEAYTRSRGTIVSC